MSAIKKFFEKRKLNVKFKKAGDGHRLDEPSNIGKASTSTAARPSTSSSPRKPESDAARRAAAEAALSRMQSSQQSKTG